jgi:hypothetical protein
MPSWLIKAAAQGAASLLPRAEQLSLMVKRVTRTLKLDEETMATKYRRCRQHLERYAVHRGGTGEDLDVLELGTGWFPITPIGFALSGARRVWTIDQVSHLSEDQVRATLRMFGQLARQGRLEGAVPERVERLETASGSVDAMLDAVGVTRVVGDARGHDLGGQKVDLIVSNNTLEHIPYDVIRSIFEQFRRVGSERVLMSHWIDMSDHYMNFDASIGPYNFLRFSSRVWRLFNNDLQYQNRLRVSDFRRLHEEGGWRVLKEENTSGSPEELRRIRVAKELRDRYTDDELLVHSTWMTSEPAR